MGKITITDDALRLAASSVREAMLSTIPPAEECSHTFSPEFESAMERLMEAEQRRHRRLSIIRKVAAVFLAAMIGVSVWLATDAPARASFSNWIREVYETYIVYRFTGEPPADALPEYRLGWIPEGYTEVSISGDDQLRNVLYSNGENRKEDIVFSYCSLFEGRVLYVFKTDDGEQVEINGSSGYFYYGETAADANGAIWIDDQSNREFTIAARLPKEVILRMAESLYLENIPK